MNYFLNIQKSHLKKNLRKRSKLILLRLLLKISFLRQKKQGHKWRTPDFIGNRIRSYSGGLNHRR